MITNVCGRCGDDLLRNCKYLTKWTFPLFVGVVTASSHALSADSLDDCKPPYNMINGGILQAIANTFTQEPQCTEQSLTEFEAMRVDLNYVSLMVRDDEYRLADQRPSLLSSQESTAVGEKDSIDRYSVERGRPNSAVFDLPTAHGYQTLKGE